MIEKNSQIQIDRLPGEVSLILPKRELGKFRKFGWALIAVGIIGIVFMFAWISFPLSMAIGAFARKDWILGLALTAFSSTGLIGLNYVKNLLIAGIGVVRDQTSTSVVWKNEQLSVVEHLSWYKWRRRCKLKNIGRLVFEKPEEKHDEVYPELVKELESLSAYELEDEKKSFVIVYGYPREILQNVANILSELVESAKLYREIDNPSVESNLGQTYAEIAKADIQSRDEQPDSDRLEIVDKAEFDQRPRQQPENSKIELEHHDGAIVFHSNPKGFFRSSKGLGIFAVIWMAIVIAITVSMIIQAVGNGGSIWMFLQLVPFWAVGIGMSWFAFQNGKHGVTLGVSKNGTWIEQCNPFGKRITKEISRKNIRKVVYANMADEGDWHSLLIQQTDGSTTQLFGGSTEEEVRWAVYEVNRELALDGQEPPEFDWQLLRVQCANSPAQTRPGIEIKEAGKTKQLSVDKDRWFRVIPGILFSLLFVGAGCFAFYCGWVYFNIIAAILGVIFVGVGSSVLGMVIICSQRTFEFTLDHKVLEVDRQGLFGKTNLVFNRDQLEVVLPQANDDGFRNVTYLQISSGVTRQKFLWGRSQKDIILVAATLNVWMDELNG